MPPSFFGFLTARATVSLANTMLTVSIGWHLYQNSGDPFDLALVGLMQIIPIFLFFFVTGWAVDSLPRKMILIICSVSEAIILAALTSVMLADVLNVTFVFGLLFLHGASKAFYTPAQQAIIPNIVPEDFVSRAVALNATIGKVFSTLGPLLAGLLITVVDFYTYLVAAGLMLVSAAAYFWLPRLARMPRTERSLSMLIAGITYVRTNSIVFGAIALDLFIVLAGSVMALLPVYATDVLQVGPDALGMLRGAPAFGGVIIGLLWQHYLRCVDPAYAFCGACCIFSINCSFRLFHNLLGFVVGLMRIRGSRHGQRQCTDAIDPACNTRSPPRQG